MYNILYHSFDCFADDVFAALDAIVGKQVWEKVVLELLRGKTRVVVTHKEDIINHPAVTFTVEISPDGNLIETKSHTHEVNSSCSSGESEDCTMRSITAVPYEDVWSASLGAASASSHGKVDDDVDEDAEDDVLCMDYSYSDKRVEKKKQGLDVEEDSGSGGIDVSVFKGYLAAAGGVKAIGIIICIQTAWQVR
jgi:ATP-binding cassette, subfamily C (CFTR/MRP), member 1